MYFLLQSDNLRDIGRVPATLTLKIRQLRRFLRIWIIL